MDFSSNNIVSVITPVYNAERYIKETIESVLSQSYTEIEYLVVDDCSTDNSVSLIKHYNDKRIQLINNPKNMGAALSRNIAIDRAKGRFIAFIDSDDIWDLNKLEQQIKILKDSDYVMSYTGFEIVDDNCKHIKYQSVPPEMTYKKLLRNTAIATSSVVIDRKKVSIDIKMPNRKTGEDYSLWLSLLKNEGKAVGLNRNLFKYRRAFNSLSKNRFKSLGDLWYGQHVQNGVGFFTFFLNYILFAINAIKKHYL